MKHRRLIAASLLLACSACTTQDQRNHVMVPWASLPVPVQKSLISAAPSESFTSVERENEAGKYVYEAKASGRTVKVDVDGKLLSATPKTSSTVAWNNLPKTVRKGITKHASGVKVDTVEKYKLSGKTVYEATLCQPNGDKHVIRVNKAGKMLAD